MSPKKIGIAFFLLILSLFSIWLIKKPSSQPSSSSTLSVIASFYPIAYFTHQVGGHLVDVRTLVSPGMEPHDFEPSPQNIVDLQKAQLFVYNGGGLETWAPRVIRDLPAEKVVNTVGNISLLPTTEKGAAYDPHVWMDPHLAIQQVAAIQKGLASVDPAHAKTYQQNAQKFTAQLQQLDAEFRQGLANCQQHTIVTSHDAFEYLAHEYGLSVLSISGLSPDAEPTPQKLAEITQFVKAHQIKYIFFESLVSPKLAQTIAQETGAQTISFNPLEGLTAEDVAQGQTYFTIQKQNLQNLRQTLRCQ